MTRKPNRYAAITAAKRNDWSAITPDTLFNLDFRQLNQLLRELGERKAPFAVMDLVQDEIRHCQNQLHQNRNSTPITCLPLKSTSTRARH